MYHHDVLYGSWEVPSIIEDLIHTKESARMRRISQSTIPHAISPKGPMANRFEHGMGVAFLAEKAIGQNEKIDEKNANLLRASALLHDAGNPPFSHLSEYFLREMLNLDGESFLSEILKNSETEQVLKQYGLDPIDVVAMVTGMYKPFSEILCGSLDIDNLDNVARAMYYFGLKHARGTFRDLAFSYHWNGDEWSLPTNMFNPAREWKEARRSVYEYIYSDVHLASGMMLYRAVELAFMNGEITKDFFRMHDDEAFMYLQRECSQSTQSLIERLTRWQWYSEVVRIETSRPTSTLRDIAGSWRSRGKLASMISDEFEIPAEDMCVYIGVGKDSRKIHLPFVSERARLFDVDDKTDISKTRLMVYVAKKYEPLQEVIKKYVVNHIG